MKLLATIFFIYSFLFSISTNAETTLNLFLSDSLKHTIIIDSSSIPDSTIIDTMQLKANKKFLIPFYSGKYIFVPKNYSLTKKNIDRIDYKYSGDLLSWLPFSYLLDLGSTGQPSESSLYGLGYGNSSLILNGTSYNNAWNNSFDLNKIQTEGIGKITLSPLSKGFLYNVQNNPVSLMIEESDTFRTKPFSRIRYLQASGEGYIDALFSAKVHKRLGLSVRITNTSVDSRYLNSSYSGWKANVKTIYKISDNFYAKLNYHHIKSKYGLNGGVSPESILNSSDVIENTLYNKTLAIVDFSERSGSFSTSTESDRYNETTFNRVDLDLFGNFFKNSFSKIKFGYENTLDKFRQHIFKPVIDSLKINNDNGYSLLFGQIKQNLSLGNLTSEFQAYYEIVDYYVDALNFNKEQTNYYTWALVNYKLFDSLLVPSVYGKILNFNNQIFNGYGVDIAVTHLNNFSISTGFSNFDKPFSIPENLLLPETLLNNKKNITTLFATVNFANSFTNTSISYFEIRTNNQPVPVFNTADIKLNTAQIIYPRLANTINKGINIFSNSKYTNILYSLNFNYYFKQNTFALPQGPEFSLSTGIYYVDTLYNNNLDLKTGFTFYLSKNFNESNYRVYDFQQYRTANSFLQTNIIHPFEAPTLNNNINRLDFLLAGRIRNSATFYFIFENILDNNYYIVPFYPMRERGIRIGLSWDFEN